MKFKPYISRIVHRVMLFIGLRGSLAADQTARMLHVLLATLAVWLAAGWVVTIPFAPKSFPRYFNPLVQEASYVTALVLLRLGYFRRASLAYLAGTWIWATLICFSAGSLRNGGALLYVSLPASAAWLLGYRAAIRTAGACLLSALVFAVLEMTHASLPLQFKPTPLGIWFVIVQAVVINAVPVGQIIGRLQETLKELAADLIERSRMDEVLRESEERFRRVFEEGPLGLALVGKDYAFLKVNTALCRMVGYSESDLLQKSFVDITHPDDLRTDVELAERLFRGEVPFYQLRKRYIKKNGDIIWINLTASIIHDQEGVPIHGIAMVEDITEVKRTQEEAFARQKLESLGVLAGGIAHDFNNLLGGIHSVAELVEMDLAVGSAPREEVQKIKLAAIRGSEIVRELMIYAGENQKDFNEAVDVSLLVEEMLKLLNVSISKQVALRTDFRGELPTVWGNAPQIRQVVMNLVLNASEAIGDTTGAITVTAAQVSGGRDLAPNNATDLTACDYVRIEVSDTGCGMTEDTKAKIFDPFFSTKFAGRGLGLAVVQGIVRDLGGAINIVSSPGQGTTFQVLLPCAPKRASEMHSTITSGGLEKSNANVRTILVVEDDETLRRAVSRGLQKKGFSVIEASDGSVALDLLQAHKNEIDVVLLDVTLPGASSRDVFEEVLRIRPDLKVIVTSAYDEKMVNAYYSGLRVNHFIRKPFHLDDLVRLSGIALSVKAG